MNSAAAAVLQAANISRRYPGVLANDDVSLTVRAREIHAIVGENGAGKSTLMKILYGEERPDRGTLSMAGRQVRFATPRAAIAAGIGLVHQHFMLADNLLVWENVVLGAEIRRRGLLDRASARAWITRIGDSHGLSVDPDRAVGDLGVGERQRVEIIKVLYRDAKVIILDEPTAVLVPDEVDRLLDSLRSLRERGISVLFISHKLDEVLAAADRITVMRAGQVVGTVDRADATKALLAEMMVGGRLPAVPARGTAPRDTVGLRLHDLTVTADGRSPVEKASLTVHAGEIVGLAGIEGNGQNEVLDAVLGLLPVRAGTILLDERDITMLGVVERRRLGLASIAADRQRHGMLLGAALWENLLLGNERLRAAFKPWRIDRRAVQHATEAVLRTYGVKAPGPATPAYALSGGNQQKFVFGREMSTRPKALLAAHPTRGVDVGAQAQLWQHLRDARDQGLAVLLVSADLEELIALSDTIYVAFSGRISDPIPADRLTPRRLGSLMTGRPDDELQPTGAVAASGGGTAVDVVDTIDAGSGPPGASAAGDGAAGPGHVPGSPGHVPGNGDGDRR
ncbi:ABC transporter ATP-binding protein [Actinomadura sp. KC216]|uniref:ABC transporter ATP-binding protein n=1 Tax=Actinomadura sp. KC216 TaxID=2530370 RepID=UPI001042B814|nr:ABC transporter ATP-binding protein [Actinomadura sp. KC216]TDB91080.1 ABC transporter ATP-binding protein [Actinomadura sp. KC216]